MDLSFQKGAALGISETSRLEFRADFFNLLNHANFASPSEAVLNPTNLRYIATAGSITRTTIGRISRPAILGDGTELPRVKSARLLMAGS